MEVTHPFPAPEEPPPQWWRIGRATIGFLMDVLAMGRGAAPNILDPLIVATVVEANVALVNRDNALGARYATLDSPPPDDLRRPVSVNAVAGSLGLPYETVRRRVAMLAKAGALASSPRGLYVPSDVLDGPAYDAVALARYERLRAFYFELKTLGALDATQFRLNDVPAYGSAPVRAANRALSEYTLRVIDSVMRAVGDPVSGVILLEMGRANAERLDPIDLQVEGPIPDERRTPISALELARRCGFPAETVRRHVQKLEEAGLCRRVKGGRLAAIERLRRSTDDGAGLAENLSNLTRLFQKCAVLGVVAHWEAEGPRA